MSHVLLYALKYLIHYLLQNPHHCDDANSFLCVFYWYYIVLLNQIIPSKDNKLRLNKAASSPQHPDKEVYRRNMRYTQCTRHEQTITITEFTMVFYQIVLDEQYFVRFKTQSKNRTPLAPLGTKAFVLEQPNQRRTFADHGKSNLSSDWPHNTTDT